MKRFLTLLSVLLSSIVFAQAAAERAHAVFDTDLWSMWNSPTQCVEVFLFLSPCFIFVTTTIVYYRFITDYTGEIAGLSVAGLFSALYICVRLLVANTQDWESHLKWVFVLFYSYVWWDAVMVACFLPRAKDQELAELDRKEIFFLSSIINWPTLCAVFLMWAAAHHMVVRQASAATVSNYVDGVIAFHLVFASLVCLLNMRFGSPPELQPEKVLNNVKSRLVQPYSAQDSILPVVALNDSPSNARPSAESEGVADSVNPETAVAQKIGQAAMFPAEMPSPTKEPSSKPILPPETPSSNSSQAENPERALESLIPQPNVAQDVRREFLVPETTPIPMKEPGSKPTLLPEMPPSNSLQAGNSEGAVETTIPEPTVPHDVSRDTLASERTLIPMNERGSEKPVLPEASSSESAGKTSEGSEAEAVREPTLTHRPTLEKPGHPVEETQS